MGSHSMKQNRFSTTKIRSNSMMITTQMKRIDFFYWVGVIIFEQFLFVIASKKRDQKIGLFQPEKQPRMNENITRGQKMKEEYDFTKMKSR